MAAVNVTFPGNLAQVQTAQDLRAIPSSLIADGDLYLVNGLQGLFEYDPGSVSIDDGTDIIRPYDKTPLQAGRWIRNVDGLASGPQGETGPANSTYTSLPLLKAAPSTNKSYTLVANGGRTEYAYVTGDFTNRADDVNVVKLDAVPLATGALVRQSTRSLTTQQDGAGSVPRSQESKSNDFINGRDYFVRADGTDELAALQAAIDAASSQGRPIWLPSGTIGISGSLDLRGRAVDLHGVPNRTTIKALASIPILINAEEATDTYHTPFNIQDIYLDGDNKVTNANLSIRFRHGYDLSNIFSINAFRAFRERDCYLSRHWNLRTGTCQIGYHIEGSNHSSLYAGCSAIGAAGSGILIESFGAVNDGNHALLFQGCDVEFGDGEGVIIGVGVSARFDGCYLGEAIGQSVIRNLGGNVEINGGIVFWGYTTATALCRPAGGRTIFRGARLAAQTNGGISNLSYLTDTELAGTYGRFRLQDVDAYLPIGGNPFLKGNVLDCGPQYRAFAPRLGRSYTPETNNVTLTTTNPTPNSVRLTCATAPGPNPVFGFYAPLTVDWRVEEPLYLNIVYRSNKDASVKFSASVLGSTIKSIGTAPASPANVSTYIKLDTTLPAIANGMIEIQINDAQVNDYFELIELYLTDSTMHKQCVGNLGALYKC